MPRLTIYHAKCLDDHSAYDVRERTLKATRAWLAGSKPGRFGAIHRITLEYDDAFHLFDRLLGEGGWSDLIIEERLARGEHHTEADGYCCGADQTRSDE